MGMGVNGVNGAGFNNPRGVAFDDSGTLWVTDEINYRVLYWRNASSLTNGSIASGVIGQFTFTARVLPSSADRTNLVNPIALAVRDSVLWVADSTWHRVLRFDNITSPTFPQFGANASAVVGQTSFSNIASGVSATLLGSPSGLLASPIGLFVIDFTNKRVVFYPASELTKQFGYTAQYVYGQDALDTFDNTALSNDQKMDLYFGGLAMATDGTLFICDYNFNRILSFDPTPPSSNAEKAVGLWGQPDFNSFSPNSGLNRLNGPSALYYDAPTNRLFVGDTNNNRIIAYDRSIIQSQPNPTIDVHLNFIAQSPAVVHTATGPNNTVVNNNKLIIKPDFIEEFFINGTLVVTEGFPTIFYTVTTSVDSNLNQIFTFDVNLNTDVRLRYTLFAIDTTLSSAGITFPVAASTLKLDILLQNTNTSLPGNRLRFHLKLLVEPNVTSLTQTNTSDIITYTLLSSNVSITTIRLLTCGVVDKSTTAQVDVSLVPMGNSTYDLQMLFPPFTTSFYYDPDFSVTLDVNSNSNGGGDGGSDFDWLPLLALIALVFIPVIFILVVAVVLTAIIVWKKVQWSKTLSDTSLTGNVNL